MEDSTLNKKISDLLSSQCTLLWLEGAKYYCLKSLKLKASQTLILKLENEVIRIVKFEKYSITKVGLQFWSQGISYILYKWDVVPNTQIISEKFSKNPAFQNPGF